jgi:uncharacterized membrane protein
MDTPMKARNVVLALMGAAILVLKPAYHGPGEVAVQSYAGNVAVSFALYFAAINATARFRRPRLLAALAALVVVEAFEIFDGFGVMANVGDPADLVANVVGIALAVVVDVLIARGLRCRPREASNDAPGRSQPTPTQSPGPKNRGGDPHSPRPCGTPYSGARRTPKSGGTTGSAASRAFLVVPRVAQQAAV